MKSSKPLSVSFLIRTCSPGGPGFPWVPTAPASP